MGSNGCIYWGREGELGRTRGEEAGGGDARRSCGGGWLLGPRRFKVDDN